MSKFSNSNNVRSDQTDQRASPCGSFSDNNNNKRLRLFGFELIKPTCNNNYSDSEVERDESVNSSNTSLSAVPTPSREQVMARPEDRRTSSSDDKLKKLKCQYCFKEFANSQALGGHQNAHKKERLKRKKLQLQARKASLHQYIHNNPSFGINFLGGTSTAPSWFFDASCYPDHFVLYDEPRISFSLPMPENTISFKQDNSSTDLDRTIGERTPVAVVVKHSAFPGSELSCKSQDVKLRLSLKSTIPNSA